MFGIAVQDMGLLWIAEKSFDFQKYIISYIQNPKDLKKDVRLIREISGKLGDGVLLG